MKNTSIKKVDFALLLELAKEVNMNNPIEAVIETLEMSDIPMTDAVRALGVHLGILLPDEAE